MQYWYGNIPYHYKQILKDFSFCYTSVENKTLKKLSDSCKGKAYRK